MKLRILIAISLISTSAFAISEGRGARVSTTSAGSWKFGIGTSLSISDKVNTDHASFTLIIPDSKFSGNLQNSLSLELDARNLGMQSWGFIGGVSIDSARQFTEPPTFTQPSGSTLIIVSTDQPKIQTTTITANAAYRWGQFFIPIGINYGIFKFTARSPNSGATPTTTGGLGGQVGFGSYVTDNILFEASYRMTAFKNTVDYGSGVIEDNGSGFITTSFLTIKYLF